MSCWTIKVEIICMKSILDAYKLAPALSKNFMA